MSHNKRHGTAELLRPLPRMPRLDRPDPDRTMVDVKAAPPRREGSIPSITGKPARVDETRRAVDEAQRAADAMRDERAREPARAESNVIPFTKPRAIAALAAQNPSAVVIDDATKPRAFEPPRFETPIARTAKPSGPSTSGPHVARRAQGPDRAPATRVATGWTPPGAVPIVKPAAPVAAPAPTVFPTSAPAAIAPPVSPPIASPVIAREALPAPVSAPAPVTLPPASVPVSLPMARTAAQMDAVAEPMFGALAEPKKQRWAIYESLGLGRPKINPQKAAKLVVNTYRLLGFVILTIIVVVLVGYLFSTAFFYMSDSWAVPMAVSPTDEKVVAVQAQLAEQENNRDRIADELAQAERSIAVQQAFQLEFTKAIQSDLAGRRSALGRIRELANTARATRKAIKNQNSAYAASSRRRMQQEYAAGLIDRNAMLSGKFQLAQITSSNLSLAERQAEFETRAAELEAQTRSLDAILANQAGDDTALSYEVLRIKQEYEASRLDLAKAVEARDTLKANLARQDKIVASLKQSSYLRAIEDGAHIAFLPYGNLDGVEKGTGVYACRVGMIVCRQVGEILEVLPGEVSAKHPHRDRMLRGQLVEMKLDDDEADAAAEDVLFIGGAPFLL